MEDAHRALPALQDGDVETAQPEPVALDDRGVAQSGHAETKQGQGDGGGFPHLLMMPDIWYGGCRRDGKMVRMSALKDKLQADLTVALKSRDEVRLRTIRMALAAVNVEEVAGKEARTLSDDEIVKVLTKEAKKRREAAEAFGNAGRAAQAQAELDEQAVLEEYLPAQLSDEELGALVEEAVAEVGATDPKAMGQVMKVLNPKVAGRAEGGRVAAAVRARLSG
ncbi:hypothetical protein GCM10009560_39960 [Nonomuraea longicatena]|uniref:GatB/YqeY domain-containing protein n=2 Tax=Nonomuraea longicatena TaxID=83682 RepID=A0ABP4A9W9_9ACTN